MCKLHPNEQLVGFDPARNKLLCNTCIFMGEQTGGAPQGKEVVELDSSGNDLKIVSLMAFELKKKFDGHFQKYKDNVVEFNSLIKPDFTQNLEVVVDSFFGTVKQRLSILEDSVLKQLDE